MNDSVIFINFDFNFVLLVSHICSLHPTILLFTPYFNFLWLIEF